MKIRSVDHNNRKKLFEVRTSSKTLFFPFPKSDPIPTVDDPLTKVFVDEEAGREAFTYVLRSGRTGTVHIGQVLEYNQDPAYLRHLLLYKLTLEAQMGLTPIRVPVILTPLRPAMSDGPAQESVDLKIFLLLVLFSIFTFWVLMVVVPLITRMIYNRVRRKGYKPIGALLIILSPWGMGVIGAALLEVHRFRSGTASFFDALMLPWIVFLVGTVGDALLLRALPRRFSRVHGPRQIPFSWVRGAWSVAAAWMVLSLAIPGALWLAGKADAVYIWMGVPFACGALGGVLVGHHYFRQLDLAVQHQFSQDEYLRRDPRPPVLYLRPFQMESYVFVMQGERNVNFEGFFSEALRELGPFVALGNPEDYAPASGAVRLYVSDTEWTQKLSDLARLSSCIVAETARSDNLRVEYEYLRRDGMQEKLFVFTGHPQWQYRPWHQVWFEITWGGILRVGWNAFAKDLAQLGYDLGFSDPGLGSVITFDASGRGILLTTQAQTAGEFVEPISAWIARREKIGRCMPTSCLSCGREFHVFPAEMLAIREKWCPTCDIGLNPFLRALKRFRTRHQTLTGWLIPISFSVIPLIGFGLPRETGGWFPRDSWIFANRGLFGLLAVIVECVIVGVAIRWIRVRSSRRVVRRYQSLAEQGDAVAMANLGILCRRGGLASGDATGSAWWFREAAGAGDIGGMIFLAEMLESGTGGLQKDRAEAIAWYQRAADLGSRAARVGLDRLRVPN